jgi:hypothetical protein
MAELFATGRIVDLILVLVVLEAAWLLLRHRRTGRGPAPADLLGNLLSGALLMLAVRGALVGAAWPWIALCLAGSVVAHLADLRRRLG